MSATNTTAETSASTSSEVVSNAPLNNSTQTTETDIKTAEGTPSDNKNVVDSNTTDDKDKTIEHDENTEGASIATAKIDDKGKGKVESTPTEEEEEPRKQYTKEDLPKADHIRREAKLLYNNGDYSEAIDKYVDVLEIYTSVYGQLGAECGELQLWYGDCLLHELRENLQLMGDDSEEYEDCWNVLEVARVIFERDAPNSSLLAMTHRKLGELNDHVCEEYEKAIEDYHKAIELYEALPEKDERAVAELHYLVGLSHSNLKAFASARESYQKAASILKTCLTTCRSSEKEDLQKTIEDIELKIEDTNAMEKEHIEKEKIEQAEKAVLKNAFQNAMSGVAQPASGNLATSVMGAMGVSSSGEGSSSTQAPSRATTLAPILTTATPTAPIVDLTKLVRRAKATSTSQHKDDNVSMIANANSSAGGSLVDGFGDGFAPTGPVADLSGFVKRKKPAADISNLVKRKAPANETNSSSTSSPKRPKPDVPVIVAPGASVDL